jgi:hypothetical protein
MKRMMTFHNGDFTKCQCCVDIFPYDMGPKQAAGGVEIITKNMGFLSDKTHHNLDGPWS